MYFTYYIGCLELSTANNLYSEKLAHAKHNEKEMIVLAWKIKELGELNDIGRKLFGDITLLVAKVKSNDSVWTVENIPNQLQVIRQTLITFIKGVTRHQRTAATHILVFMVSEETRRRKPYALPAQCLPYKGLADSKVRDLANEIISEMCKRQMKVAGEHCQY